MSKKDILETRTNKLEKKELKNKHKLEKKALKSKKADELSEFKKSISKGRSKLFSRIKGESKAVVTKAANKNTTVGELNQASETLIKETKDASVDQIKFVKEEEKKVIDAVKKQVTEKILEKSAGVLEIAKIKKQSIQEQIKTYEEIRDVELSELSKLHLTVDAHTEVYEKIKNKYQGLIENLMDDEAAQESKIRDIESVEEADGDVRLQGNNAKPLTIKQIRRMNTSPDRGKRAITMASGDNVVEIRNVDKYYTTTRLSTHVLKNIDLEIKKGDFVILFGKSGSGKSTLLNLLSGLDRATKGDIAILGQNLSRMRDFQLTSFRRKNMGFIFQSYNLLPNLNAYENAETGAYLQKKKKRLDIKETFKLMDIEDVLYKYPSEMSGGQQQRVSIARALVKNPDILFADEPTGALDEKMTIAVLKILKRINKEYGTTIIMVSHNPILAEMASKVVTLRLGHIHNIQINKNPKEPDELAW